MYAGVFYAAFPFGATPFYGTPAETRSRSLVLSSDPQTLPLQQETLTASFAQLDDTLILGGDDSALRLEQSERQSISISEM